MIALAKLLVIGFLALTVVYVSLSFYSRAARCEKLEERWATRGRVGDRDAFVRRGLERYDGSIRRQLILGVYIVPLVTIALIVYFTNFH